MKVKVLTVKGDIRYTPDGNVSTLPESIEKELNKFEESLDGKVEHIEPVIDFGTLTTGGQAMFIIRYEGEIKKFAPRNDEAYVRKPGRPPKFEK